MIWFKENLQHFGKYTYSRSCQEVEEKIDNALISVQKWCTIPLHLSLYIEFVFAYLQHAEAGSLDISSTIHITLHKIYAILSQPCQQDALQVACLLHLVG